MNKGESWVGNPILLIHQNKYRNLLDLPSARKDRLLKENHMASNELDGETLAISNTLLELLGKPSTLPEINFAFNRATVEVKNYRPAPSLGDEEYAPVGHGQTFTR